jgi:hypothetical protein
MAGLIAFLEILLLSNGTNCFLSTFVFVFSLHLFLLHVKGKEKTGREGT